MSCHDLLGIADGGKVGLLVPTLEEVEIGGDLRELSVGEIGDIRMKKSAKVHGETVIVEGSSFKFRISSWLA